MPRRALYDGCPVWSWVRNGSWKADRVEFEVEVEEDVVPEVEGTTVVIVAVVAGGGELRVVVNVVVTEPVVVALCVLDVLDDTVVVGRVIDEELTTYIVIHINISMKANNGTRTESGRTSSTLSLDQLVSGRRVCRITLQGEAGRDGGQERLRLAHAR